MLCPCFDAKVSLRQLFCCAHTSVALLLVCVLHWVVGDARVPTCLPFLSGYTCAIAPDGQELLSTSEIAEHLDSVWMQSSAAAESIARKLHKTIPLSLTREKRHGQQMASSAGDQSRKRAEEQSCAASGVVGARCEKRRRSCADPTCLSK